MAKQTVNIGTSVNKGNGDPLRTAFTKINNNFTELYTALGLNLDGTLNLGAFEFTGSVMSTTNNSSITIDQALTVTSNLTVSGNIFPSGGVLGQVYGDSNELTLKSPIGGGGVGYVALASANEQNYVEVNNDKIVLGVEFGQAGFKKIEFDNTGILTLPDSLTLPNGAVIKDTASDAVAFGEGAGLTSQGDFAVAIGYLAGETSQGADAVAIGETAGTTSQGAEAIAIGYNAGADTQGTRAVAISIGAGQTNQGSDAIAIGYNAGTTSQGVAAVAIGALAGETSQGNNSIIINATGTALDQTISNTFTVAPIRNIGGTSGVLQYNAATKEVSYSSDIRSEGAINIDVNLTDSTLRRWRFGEDGGLTFPDGTSQTTAYQKVSSLADESDEVTFGVIGVRIIDSSGCKVQIRATSSLIAHYNMVVNSGSAGTAFGTTTLTTSFIDFPNTALNNIATKVDILIKIDSLGVAYRIQILTGSGTSPWNNNLIVIEQLL